jgi:hypothetical protein
MNGYDTLFVDGALYQSPCGLLVRAGYDTTMVDTALWFLQCIGPSGNDLPRYYTVYDADEIEANALNDDGWTLWPDEPIRTVADFIPVS